MNTLLFCFILIVATIAKEEWKEGEFFVTAYCSCEQCCGKWADGFTATNTKARWGVVAVDPNIISLGSIVTIEGFDDLFHAEDVGLFIKKNCIDIWFPTHEEALVFGRQIKKIRWKEKKK